MKDAKDIDVSIVLDEVCDSVVPVEPRTWRDEAK